jgi:hypothetical protein
MEKKLPYEDLKLKVIFFASSDIVTASGGNDFGEDPGENDGEWM